MNWKQIYTLATPEERLDLALHMLRRIEAQREVVIVYVDLRRMILRAMFIGVLGILTFTTAIITAKAEPVLVAPVITLYVAIIFSLLLLRSQKQTAHYVNATR